MVALVINLMGDHLFSFANLSSLFVRNTHSYEFDLPVTGFYTAVSFSMAFWAKEKQ